jgi:hypothetical protein
MRMDLIYFLNHHTIFMNNQEVRIKESINLTSSCCKAIKPYICAGQSPKFLGEKNRSEDIK